MHGDFGWELPPGVTDAMIDDAMGEADDRDECPRCAGSGRRWWGSLHPSLQHNARLIDCDRCDGTGRIAPPEREYDRGDR